MRWWWPTGDNRFPPSPPRLHCGVPFWARKICFAGPAPSPRGEKGAKGGVAGSFWLGPSTALRGLPRFKFPPSFREGCFASPLFWRFFSMTIGAVACRWISSEGYLQWQAFSFFFSLSAMQKHGATLAVSIQAALARHCAGSPLRPLHAGPGSVIEGPCWTSTNRAGRGGDNDLSANDAVHLGPLDSPAP